MNPEPRVRPDAHIERPSSRRDVAALGVSLIIHALAIIVVFLTHASDTGGTPREGDVTADIIVRDAAPAPAAPAAQAAPAVTVAARPVRPVPRPTIRPVALARPVPRRVVVRPTPPPPRKPELAVLRPSAPPQPTPPPTEPPTPPPTTAPERVPTAVPTILVAVATAPPTKTPTEPPTEAPTAPPTRTPTAPPTAAASEAPATAAPTRPPTSAPTAAATAVATSAATNAPRAVSTAAPNPAQGSPKPVASAVPGTPRPAATTGAQPAANGPKPAASGAPGAGAASPAPRGGSPATAAPIPVRNPVAANPSTPAPERPPSRGTAAPSPASSANADLNARLRALLPKGGVTMQHYPGGTIDKDTASQAYERLVRPPADVLAATFGIIRERRTEIHADSVTYVYGDPHKNLFGRTVCRGWRVTDHPLPPPPTAPPSLQGGRPNLSFPGPPPDLKPIVDEVEVACDDARMEKHVRGTLATPVPRHP